MNEDKIIQKLLEHDEELRIIKETMATKADLEKIVHTQDEMLVILKRIDQERVITNDTIKKMKVKLKMA